MKKTCKFTASGFTLIELLVTIAIIAILIGIVAGVASVANRKSAESQAKAGLQQLANALENYRVRYGVFPNTLENLRGDNDEPVEIKDPWGRDYIYSVDASNYQRFDLKSDGVIANDDADDIAYGMDGL